MAKTKSASERAPKAALGSYGGKPRPFSALIFLVVGTLLLLSFIVFDLDQNPIKGVEHGPGTEENGGVPLVGKFGEYIPFYILWGFGISAWVIPIFCLWLGYMHLFRRSHLLKWPRILSLFVFTFSVSIFGTLAQEMFFQDKAGIERIHNDWGFANGLGGTVGNLLYLKGLKVWLGPVGTGIVNGAVLLISLLALFTSELVALVERLALRVGKPREIKRDKDRPNKEEPTRKEPPKKSRAKWVKPLKMPNEGKGNSGKRSKGWKKKAPTKQSKSGKGTSKTSVKIVGAVKTRKAKRNPIPSKKGDYTFPTLDLLEFPSHRDQELNQAEQDKTVDDLKKTLANFNVKVDEHVEALAGPVITRYEVKPAPGIKVSKILGLNNDIALGLKAMKVRIQAPVPGKGTVGIEVPNKKPESVYMRDIIESEDWANFRDKAEIPIALGKEVSGRPLIADLTRMPHLLVAGATGSGKTVCINSIIASMLYHSSPEDMRFIMVDPKIVEMQVYNDLPQMLIPVVTEPKKVPGALKWLIAEMERRYQVFAEVGVRNIASFNDKQKAKRKAQRERATRKAGTSLDDSLGMENIPEAQAPDIEVPRDADIEIPDKFPYIVCFIDELADLMMVAQKDVETSITRLAQLARAAGIHLIIATQRPSVNVITGIIKANLPCRIAFQTSSKVDSRTILDQVGAEQLIGRGDMLFNPPGSADLIRSQGCFVSDEEINHIVEFLKQNGPPQFAQDVQRQVEATDDDLNSLQDAGDALFPDAIEVLRTSKRASTSMLQRRLKIGYNRAARIMDLMEARGIVGPENGPQPREILKDLDTL